MTNSPINAKFVDDSVVCEDNIFDLFEAGVKKKDDKDLIKHQMNVVKYNHTYINRINGMLKVL